MSPRLRILLSCPEIYAQCHCGQLSNKQNTAGLCPMVPSLSWGALTFEEPASSQHRRGATRRYLTVSFLTDSPIRLRRPAAEQSVAFACWARFSLLGPLNPLLFSRSRSQRPQRECGYSTSQWDAMSCVSCVMSGCGCHKFATRTLQKSALQSKTTHHTARRNALFYMLFPGGTDEDRTHDLRIANAALSQLSYRPVEGDYRLEWGWPQPAGSAGVVRKLFSAAGPGVFGGRGRRGGRRASWAGGAAVWRRCPSARG